MDKQQSKYFGQVADYVEDKLSEEAVAAFEAALAQDDRLVEAVEAYFRDEVAEGKKVTEAFAEKHWHEMIQTANGTREAKVVPFHLRYKWALLAASLVGVMMMAYFLFPTQPLSQEELFADHFKMPPIERITVVKGNKNNAAAAANVDSLKWEAAIDYYQKEDFRESLRMINSIDTTTINSDFYADYLCLKGILLIHQGDYQTAYTILRKEETARPKEKEWYSALVLLKLSQSKEELLDVFSNLSDERNQEKAIPIVKMLQKN